jgi:hypothetical protein
MNNDISYLIEFFPGIWISNSKTFNEKFLKQKRIDKIIDCEKELNFFENAENYIESIKKEIKKTNHQRLHKYLIDITQVTVVQLVSSRSVPPDPTL